MTNLTRHNQTITFSLAAFEAVGRIRSELEDAARLRAATQAVIEAANQLDAPCWSMEMEWCGVRLLASDTGANGLLVETLDEVMALVDSETWDELSQEVPENGPGLYFTAVPGGGAGTVYAASRMEAAQEAVEHCGGGFDSWTVFVRKYEDEDSGGEE